MRHWIIIHNPRACSGKSAKMWPQFEQQLQAAGISYERHLTTSAGHATTLTQQCIAAGGRNILAMGGDGTVNEVVNGIMAQQAVPSTDILLTQLPVGTGNDWRRTMGLSTKVATCIAMLRDPAERLQDLGHVAFLENGQPQGRFFMNVAGMGFEAAVGIRANAQKAAGKGGPLGYYPALVSCLIGYQCTDAAFKVDDKSLPGRKFFSMAIGICNYNGGGMKQCPAAIPDDGLLDLTLINQAPKYIIVANVPRLFTGGFVSIKYVEQHRMKELHVDTGPETLLEVDGEDLGRGSATFTVHPRALRVAIPKPV